MIHPFTKAPTYRLESYCLGQWMWVETWQEQAGLLEYLRKCDRAKWIEVNGRRLTAGEYLDEYEAQSRFVDAIRHADPATY